MSNARAAVLLAAAILSPSLAACASDNSDASTPAQKSTSEPASSSAGSTTSAGSDGAAGSATVDEYASLVAQYATDLKSDIRDGLDPEQCSWGAGPPDRDSSGHCSDSAATIQQGARSLADRLTAAQADTGLGAPPDQISTLVKDTIKAAKATDKRAEPALECAQDYTRGCNPKAVRWSEAMRAMRDQLTAWGQYL